jgi:Glycine transporter
MAAVVPVTEAFRWLDLTGVLANAVLGGAIARSARLDVVGFATLAILSGLGGGVIRDTLLQHGTPVALTDYWYLLIALAGATLVFLVKVEGRVWDRVWPLIDALALGCWAAAGAQKTLTFGLGWLELRTTNLKSVVGRLNRHVRPIVGAVSVSRLDAETLESFYAQLRRCRERCGSGRPYIPADRWRLRRSG